MEKETEKQNLGSGSISGLMIKLAVPTIIAQLVNLLYNLVDRIYIGHIREVGDIALTGLGLCFPVLMMVTAFAMLIGSGGAPRAAIYMGKGDNETAERILGNSVTSLIVISVVLTIFLEAVAEPILWMFGASEKTLPFADLCGGEYFCHDDAGIEYVYHNTGICKDQYEDSSDRSNLQYHS